MSAPEAADPDLAPEALLEATDAAVRRGRASGALEPLIARVETVEEAGLRFAVRVLVGMERKIARTRAQRRSGTNPFLPPDPELTVGNLTPSHRVVLNKYPVIERHLLIVTRAFARQEGRLDLADFAAALTGLAAFPSLAFFNGGRAAGSSQGHKHLQLVPLPLGADGDAIPLERHFAAADVRRELPFRFVASSYPADDAAAALARYEDLLVEAGLATSGDPRPYNLLLTRRWLALVPRALGAWEGIPTNGLGYAGALFARGDAQLARIREVGPLRVLREAGVPW